MVAVIVCSLFNMATLVGLFAGIVCGMWRARAEVGAALVFDALAFDAAGGGERSVVGNVAGLRRRAVAARLWLA